MGLILNLTLNFFTDRVSHLRASTKMVVLSILIMLALLLFYKCSKLIKVERDYNILVQ